MIFATDAFGNTTYVSAEWTGLTGRSVEEAMRLDWLEQAHPADRDMVRSTLLGAIKEHAPFRMSYRLKNAGEHYVWVLAGAVPSFSPADHTFIGFMGSVTEIAMDERDELKGSGSIGVRPIGLSPGAPSRVVLERVADHLLLSHSLITMDGNKELLPSIELALYQVGRKLAASAGVGASGLH